VHPEDAGGPVFVRVLGTGSLALLGLQFGVLRLEGVGDVLEKDEAEDDVLVGLQRLIGRLVYRVMAMAKIPDLMKALEERGVLRRRDDRLAWR
jgi:hypothetical protein